MVEIFEGGSVLLVDDDRPIRELYRKVLVSAGIGCASAVDGAQALAKLENRRFDAVVMDLVMPDREGIETIIEVRARWPETFIIAISGGGCAGPRELLELAATVGADRTLAKPFTAGQLLAMLAGAPLLRPLVDKFSRRNAERAR